MNKLLRCGGILAWARLQREQPQEKGQITDKCHCEPGLSFQIWVNSEITTEILTS